MSEDKFTLEIEGLKIVEWLVSRNKLPKLWEKSYKGSQLILANLSEKMDKRVDYYFKWDLGGGLNWLKKFDWK